MDEQPGQEQAETTEQASPESEAQPKPDQAKSGEGKNIGMAILAYILF